MTRWKSKKDFCAHLKSRRLRLALSQEDVSQRLGQSPGYITMVERGHFLPREALIVQLARIYGDPPMDYLDMKQGGDKRSRAFWREILAKESEDTYGVGGKIPVVTMEQVKKWIDFRDLDYPMSVANEFAHADTQDDRAFYIRCDTDALAPLVNREEIVLVEPGSTPEHGDVILTRIDDDKRRGIIFRILHIGDDAIMLLSNDSVNHPPITIRSESEITCYKCTWAARKLGG